MRVAWITSGFPTDKNDSEGAAFLQELARELSKNIDLTIFSLYSSKSQYKFNHAVVFTFGIGTPELNVMEKLGILKRCNDKFKEEHLRKPFDLVHSMWAGESGYVASKLAKKFKLPLIVNVCGGELAELREINYGSRTKFWQKIFVGVSFKEAKKIIYGSDFIGGEIEKYYGKKISDKLVKIPFGIDEKIFHPKPKPTNDKITLLCIAHAVPVKDHRTLFKSFKIVHEKIPNTELHCYGRDVEKFQTMIQKENLQDSVKLFGFINHNDMPEVYRNANIFVCSSLYESQNISMLEASFCGLDVVSTNVGIAPEITEFISEPGNYKMLAKKIIEAIKHSLNTITHKTTPLINKSFSLDSSSREFLDLYLSFQTTPLT